MRRAAALVLVPLFAAILAMSLGCPGKVTQEDDQPIPGPIIDLDPIPRDPNDPDSVDTVQWFATRSGERRPQVPTEPSIWPDCELRKDFMGLKTKFDFCVRGRQPYYPYSCDDDYPQAKVIHLGNTKYDQRIEIRWDRGGSEQVTWTAFKKDANGQVVSCVLTPGPITPGKVPDGFQYFIKLEEAQDPANKIDGLDFEIGVKYAD